MRILDKVKIWIKLNLYNPYNPHFVYSKKLGGYFIRQYKFWSGWEFLDIESTKFFWWTGEDYVKKYCKYETLALAKDRLLQYNEWISDDGFTYIPFED